MFFYCKNEYINYILNVIAKVKINKNIKKVTQIQIQKIIYIVYSYYLIFDKKITAIDFETWRWGPVIYELWKEQTKFSKMDIPLTFDEKLDQEICQNFNNESKQIYIIVEFLLSLKSWDIVVICHEQTPWKKLYKPNKNILIKDQDIISFYNENKNNFFDYIDFVIKNALK